MFSLTLATPEASPRLAVITIDRPGEKVNAIAPSALVTIEEQFAALDSTPGLAGVVLISDKPDNFIAGADIDVFAAAKDRKEIEAFGRKGHEVLRRIAASKLPIVAAIRSNRSMSVESLGKGGRAFADVYALKGAATAIDAAAMGCARR